MRGSDMHKRAPTIHDGMTERASIHAACYTLSAFDLLAIILLICMIAYPVVAINQQAYTSDFVDARRR